MNEKRGFELHPNYDYKYDAELREKFQARKPKKVFDAHFHLSPNEIPGVPSDEIFDEWFKLTEDYVMSINGGQELDSFSRTMQVIGIVTQWAKLWAFCNGLIDLLALRRFQKRNV